MSKNGESTDLRVRTKKFALRIIKLYTALPKSNPAQVLANQLLRSGTSVGAQYAEACHAKSKPDFINKIDNVRQELEETVYWIELLIEAEIVKDKQLKPLVDESRELIAIFVAMSKKTKFTIELDKK